MENKKLVHTLESNRGLTLTTNCGEKIRVSEVETEKQFVESINEFSTRKEIRKITCLDCIKSFLCSISPIYDNHFCEFDLIISEFSKKIDVEDIENGKSLEYKDLKKGEKFKIYGLSGIYEKISEKTYFQGEKFSADSRLPVCRVGDYEAKPNRAAIENEVEKAISNKVQNEEMTLKGYKSFQKRLNAIKPILNSENCQTLADVKASAGYEAEFRVMDGKLFLTYTPELKRQDMDNDGFVLSRISPIYDKLQRELIVR